MPKISTYSTVTPADSDLILITDASDSNNTKNVTVSALRSGILLAASSYTEIYDDSVGNVTTIATAGTFVLMATGTTQGLTNDVTLTTNGAGRITNTSGVSKTFAVTYSASATTSSGNNQNIMFRLVKNGQINSIPYSETDTVTGTGGGSKAASASNTVFVTLANNDYIELWCTNGTAPNNVLLEHLNLSLRQI